MARNIPKSGTDRDEEDGFEEEAELQETAEALSPIQELALVALVAGGRVTETAAELGIGRSTLHRWLRDPYFEAAYNRARRELRETVELRLLTAAEKAAETVAKAIEDGDPKAAVELLKGLGLLSGRARYFGLEDPDAIADERFRGGLGRAVSARSLRGR